MKKNLFYAAFALAMMASCTNEDNLVVDPVEPTPEDKVALNLGVVAPSVNATVGARGTGSVGDVKGDNNVWNSQQLYIAMINRETGNLANVDETATQKTPIMDWKNYTYRAPRKAANVTDSIGTIRIYQNNNAPTTPEGDGTIQWLYYPTQGTFDFYGWHLDDATITAGTEAAPNPAISASAANGTTASTTSIAIKGITIDGTQDIMGAKTKAANADTYGSAWKSELEGWAFSARTARNEIDPILKFEHKLARLKFFVKAGSYSAALYGEGNTAKNKQDENDNTSTGAMYITGIQAFGMHSVFDMTLDNAGITTSNPSSQIPFILGDILAADGTTGTPDEGKKKGEIGSLIPVAPKYHKDYVPTGETGEAKVGESIMFLPVAAADGATTLGTDKEIKLKIDLKQYLQKTNVEPGTTGEWGYESQSAEVTIKAEHVKKTDGSYADSFKAGESYNVYITIYGFERIEVSAELTPWKDGGDVDVDIEEGTSKGDQSQTPAVEKTTVTFNISGLQDQETATIVLNNETKTYTSGGEAVTFEVDRNTAYTYTVEATGYDKIENGEISTAETATETHTEEVTLTATQTQP